MNERTNSWGTAAFLMLAELGAVLAAIDATRHCAGTVGHGLVGAEQRRTRATPITGRQNVRRARRFSVSREALLFVRDRRPLRRFRHGGQLRKDPRSVHDGVLTRVRLRRKDVLERVRRRAQQHFDFIQRRLRE